EIENMRRDMERIFEGLGEPFLRGRVGARPGIAQSGSINPNIEMYDKGTEIAIRGELPGIDRKDVDLVVTSDTLNVRGEIRKPAETKDVNYYLSEIGYGTFSRTIALPVEVENEKARAGLKDGVLDILLPNRQDITPKEIRIHLS
ncbi:MAG: Hsp20/alpha crystallin family protein, partial [Thermodesulfovibrionales bacterium]